MSHIGVTITGADDLVRIQDLADLSAEFPFVEWGVLFSPDRRGSPRYPMGKWIRDLGAWARPPGLILARLSLHLCGRAARDLLAGDDRWLEGADFFRRVQVNGYAPPAPALVDAASILYEREFVLQVRSEEHLAAAAADARLMGNASLLFDPPGGRGLGPASWPARPPGVRMGYAGGGSPDDVGAVLEAVPASDGTWINMESGVRTNDRFDLVKVRRVLERVWLHNQQNATATSAAQHATQSNQER